MKIKIPSRLVYSFKKKYMFNVSNEQLENELPNLVKLFGDLPITFTSKHIPHLEILSKLTDNINNLYMHIIAKIRTFDEVTIDGEYDPVAEVPKIHPVLQRCLNNAKNHKLKYETVETPLGVLLYDDLIRLMRLKLLSVDEYIELTQPEYDDDDPC